MYTSLNFTVHHNITQITIYNLKSHRSRQNRIVEGEIAPLKMKSHHSRRNRTVEAKIASM
jgi:hypothetical protein